MKKSLLTILSAALSLSSFAQMTPSPQWSTIQNSSFTVAAAGIRFLDAVSPNDIWAIGYDGFAYKRNYNWFTVSNNGGNTFTSGEVFPGDTSTYVLANLEGVDATTAWVSYYMKGSQAQGGVHQTTNTGATWVNMTPAGGYTNAASFTNLVCFLTPSIGIIQGDPIGSGLGEFEIYRTTDGGATWNAVAGANISNPISGEYGIVDVYTKYGTNDIWFGTNKNRIYHSNDAGMTWTVTPTALTSTLGAAVGIDKISFSDANNGILTAWFGPTTASTLTLWNTTNGGVTWTQIPSIDPNFGRNEHCGIPGVPGWYASVGAASTNTVISYSMDNGVTWINWNSFGIQYLEIDFVDNTNGWAGSFSSQVVIGTEGIFKYDTSIPLGVKNQDARPLATSVYPNPSNGVFSIKMPPAKEGYVLTVFDMMGKQVYSYSAKTPGFETLSFDLSHLGKGIYSVNITKGNETSTNKIIIE